jgi:hypothetical protein
MLSNNHAKGRGRGPLGSGEDSPLSQIPKSYFQSGVTPTAVPREVGMPKVTQAKMCEMCGKRYTKEVLGPDDIHDLRTGDHRGTCGKCWRREFDKMLGVKSA